jgi:hypothetical protein
MRAAWVWVEAASRLLAPDEREAVLGDLLEAGESSWSAMLSVLGLVLRREAQLWKSWKPWVAAFGLTLPSSFMLMSLSLTFAECLPLLSSNALGVKSHVSLTHVIVGTVIPETLMLLGMAFVDGYVVATLSRRTLWLSVVACLFPCLFCFERFRLHSLSPFCLMLFLLPAVWGVLGGVRRWRIGFKSTSGLAALLTLLAIFYFHGGWVVFAPLLWPAWYMAAIAPKRTQQT